MNIWELVKCPDDMVPRPNKWVLVKKYNKAGKSIKYKARLVIKGCAQHLGFNYNQTFVPVVRIETIQAILALVLTKDLKIQQMDVKGAYLNGLLSEQLYMRQLKGYNDGTGHACHLIKTLYGLKQAGCKWNHKFDKQLHDKRFEWLKSNPCAYICGKTKDLSIITIWVDDLLIYWHRQNNGTSKNGP